VRKEVAQLLINAGSPLAHKNKAGKTISDLAFAAHDSSLINIIRDALNDRIRDKEKELSASN
jgi:hypothetical protein